MGILYWELNMGAAGDMLLASLLELMPDRDAALSGLNALGIPGVEYSAVPAEKCGVTGTRAVITVHGEEEAHHHGYAHERVHVDRHRGISDISNIISNLNVSNGVKKQALGIYGLLAGAEAKVHGKPAELVHFHELGALDAVADIVGVCYLLERLAPERILASAVTVGFGQVRCAHGTIPVPAPATAELLKGIPMRAGTAEGELCTPTGAALLKYLVQDFGPMPALCVSNIGCGCGKKDFESANILRAFLGKDGVSGNQAAELCCNLDDMTGEDIAFAAEQLLKGGALDVWTAPVYMKKNRPGVMLCCLCKPGEADKFAKLMLTHTTTIGLRKKLCSRYTLEREITTRRTPLGEVRFKVTRAADGTVREKPEYDDLVKLV